MEEHQRILRRAGWLLVGLGCLDIVLMVYCIVNELSYSSSLNIFAVAAGVLLVRGSLRTVRAVAWFFAFLLSGFGTLLIVFPFLRPWGLWLTQLRATSWSTVISLAFSLTFLLLLGWIYRELRAPAVLEASSAAGLKTPAPKIAFALGVSLVIGLGVILKLVTGGAAGAKAIELAKKEVGAGYSFHVEGMRWSGHHVSQMSPHTT